MMLNSNSTSFPFKGVFSLWITFLFLAALLLAAYPVDGRGADANNNREPAGKELSLYDSITFDVKLSRALAAKLAVVTVSYALMALVLFLMAGWSGRERLAALGVTLAVAAGGMASPVGGAQLTAEFTAGETAGEGVVSGAGTVVAPSS